MDVFLFPFFGATQCERGGAPQNGGHGSMTGGWRKTASEERQRLKTEVARNE